MFDAINAIEREFEPYHVRPRNTLTWRQSGGMPDVSYHFAGFWEAAEEQSMARIFGGVHYRFNQEAGQRIGTTVAEFVFTNYMTPPRRGND